MRAMDWAKAGIAALAVALAACQQPAERQSADTNTAVGPALPAKPSADALGQAASADVRAFYEGEFEAFGAEPDWKLDLLDNWASFSRTGLEDIGGLPGQRDIRTGGAMIEAGPLSITLKAGSCTYAGNAEAQLPYVVSVFFEGVTYEGCGRRATGAGGATPSWSALLPELIAPIDLCLARVQAQPARVTIAYVTEGANVSVRLLDGDGGRYECGVDGAAKSVSYFEPIGDRDVIQGERNPAFQRGGDKPAGACVEEAKGPAGDSLGWLIRRSC